MISENPVLTSGARALDFFFTVPAADGTLKWQASGTLELLRLALTAVPAPGRASAADCLNALAAQLGSDELSALLYGELFAAFIRRRVLPPELTAPVAGSDAAFLLDHVADLATALAELPGQLSSEERAQLLPSAAELFGSALPEHPETLDRNQLRRWCAGRLAACDNFKLSRTFRFVNGEFLPVTPDSAKPLEKFFGFPSVRAIYRDHFGAFAAGKSNLPLLIYSLPGYGKTSMTVSHALAHPEIVLILPEPEALERDWSALIAPLRRRPDRKFVIFFDDVDPRSVNWYNFRTHVGGAFSLPANVMPVISSNYEFPAGILSRGRRLSYPVFDELRCTEMIEDYLRDFGLRRVPANLVSLIGADYTEEFGQKKFSELSPRTLMRYLLTYEDDREKRRTLAEMSLGELVTRPDAELFYEFNIELMRSLYGEEYIQKLLKRKLKDLE